MSSFGLVSIITPSFNSKQYLLETYESIKAQSYSNWEWIVTDDCSSDGTAFLMQRIASIDKRVIFLSNEKNSGAAVSRNLSIGSAKGEFIAFIDSDDLWLPDKLEKQIKFMKSNELDFTFTAYELIDDKSVKLGKQVDTHLRESVTYELMLKKRATLGCSTVIIRQNAFEDITMPLIRTGQDYALWLKLLRTGVKAYALQDVLTQYRILPNSISRNKFKKAKRQWEIYRAIEKLTLLKSIECFCFYAWRAVFRK